MHTTAEGCSIAECYTTTACGTADWPEGYETYSAAGSASRSGRDWPVWHDEALPEVHTAINLGVKMVVKPNWYETVRNNANSKDPHSPFNLSLGAIQS